MFLRDAQFLLLRHIDILFLYCKKGGRGGVIFYRQAVGTISVQKNAPNFPENALDTPTNVSYSHFQPPKKC